MPGPVERWLETFMCKQYADSFEAYGYQTLQSVCQLRLPQLLAIGVAREHCDSILENVHVLRQTLMGSMQQYPEDIPRGYDNDPHGPQPGMGIPFQQGDSTSGGSMPVNMPVYGQHSSNCGSQGHMMMSHQQRGPQTIPTQNQQYNQVYRNPYPGPGPGYQGTRPEMGARQEMVFPNMNPRFQNPNCNQRSQYPVTQVQGSMSANQATVQQAHPHLRNSGQTPQEVANSILQIASSNYPSHHTVQVPLAKNRPAPYQVPPRSPLYNLPPKQLAEPQLQGQQTQINDYQNSTKFMYPHSSPQMMQHNRMSPISPNPGMIQSPHSHHSGQSLPNSSPHGSVPSPIPGGIKSPGSDRSSVRSPMLNSQHMSSPQGITYQSMTSQQLLTSPVPMNQQLQVSVSANSSSSQRAYSMYGDHVTSPSNQSQHSHHSTHFSPSSNPMNSPGRFSNISSPYTPGSKASHYSPNQTYAATSSASQYLSDVGSTIDSGAQDKNSGSNPLRSLQKLCMLPERQVVDPKSVVNDACLPSPQQVYPKNSECDAGVQDISCSNKGDSNEPASLAVSHTCSDGSNCSPKLDHGSNGNEEAESLEEQLDASGEDMNCNVNLKNDNTKTNEVEKIVVNVVTGKENLTCVSQKLVEGGAVTVNSTHLSEKTEVEKPRNSELPAEEIKRQPKKEMLLRAAQDSANKQKQELISKNDGCDKQVSETENGLVSECEQTCQFEKCSDNSSSIDADTKELDIVDSNVDEKILDKQCGQTVGDAADNTAFIKNVSDSEADQGSELAVDHDHEKNKKENADIALSTDLSSRVRGLSTGSFSDENSDFDLEDHIGCDDNNQISDDSITEKENIMDLHNTEDVENAVKFSSVNEVKSAIVLENGCKVKIPSSPHWKKSKLNDLQALQHENNQICDEHIPLCTEEDSIKCKKKPRPSARSRKIRKPINCSVQVNSHDSDSGGFCPNSITEVDNGDGTIIVTKRKSRQRKQPLKYKDTSFLQCDFIFAEEEEDEDFDFEPKKKSKKTSDDHLSTDQNKEIKKIGFDDKNGKILFRKNGLSKTHRPTEHGSLTFKDSKNSESDKFDSKADIKQLDLIQLNCETNENDSNDNIYASLDSDKEFEEVCDNDSPPKSCDNESSVTKTRNHEQKNDHGKDFVSNLAKSGQTGSSSEKNQAKTAKGTRSVTKKCDSESVNQHSRKSMRLKKLNNNSSLGDTVDGLVSAKEKQTVSLEKNALINVSSSDDKNLNGMADVKKEEKVEEFDEVTVDLTYSDDEVVDNASSLKHEKETRNDKKEKSKRKHTAVIKSEKRRTKLKSAKTKERNKKKSDRRKAKFYDVDSDYEAGPKSESFKSLNLNKTHDLVSKKKKHEKLDFKGPMIHIEGSKEFPEKCAVVNQPFQDGDLKSSKTKTVIQNVTSVEISHLPSDRSVFIPNAENEETDTWVCSLCGKHSSYKFTGDLFGPYSLEVAMEGEKIFPTKHSVSNRGSRSRSVDSTSASGQSSRSLKIGQRSHKETSLWKEVWVHECCAVWADGVFLLGTKIYGLQEAAKIASKTVCSRCHEHGAMVGCLHKGCQMKFHHSCAMEEDCILDEENFSLLCPKHKSKKFRQPDPSFSSWG